MEKSSIGHDEGSKEQKAPTTTQPDVSIPHAPDEEDDPGLDDLDVVDILDEFSNTKIDSKPDGHQLSGPDPQAHVSDPGKSREVEDDKFAEQLQAGMADLLEELDKDPELAAQLEGLAKTLAQVEDSEPPDPSKPGNTAASSSTGAEDSFQEKVRKTMERMQSSADQASAAANTDDGDDMLAQLMKAMAATEGGEGGNEDLTKVFLGMMEQLTNKEMLYEPMKELNSKFSPWIEENKEKITKAELERYQGQSKIVKEIVTKFEEPDFSDEKPAHREYIWERMQKMQAAGSPPEALIANPLPDELRGGPGEEPQCPQQ